MWPKTVRAWTVPGLVQTLCSPSLIQSSVPRQPCLLSSTWNIGSSFISWYFLSMIESSRPGWRRFAGSSGSFTSLSSQLKFAKELSSSSTQNAVSCNSSWFLLLITSAMILFTCSWSSSAWRSRFSTRSSDFLPSLLFLPSWDISSFSFSGCSCSKLSPSISSSSFSLSQNPKLGMAIPWNPKK